MKFIILTLSNETPNCYEKLIHIFFNICFSLNSFADTVSDKEKEALIKLYHATDGSQWTIKWDLTLISVNMVWSSS